MIKQREALKRLYTIIREPPMSPLEHRLADIIEEALVEPVCKPLTDSELWEMWAESPSDVLRFARAIERAHGITE